MEDVGIAWGIVKDDAERDESVLIRAAQADPAAFDALYRRYLGRVYWYLRARLPEAGDADDLTQQVFLHALEALPRYRDRGVPFSAWLFRIARNTSIDAHRRRRPVIPWTRAPVVAQRGTEQDPEARVLQREELHRLRAILATLRPEQCELLALRFAAGLTAHEIAVVVGKSEAAIKKRLARTMHVLKEQYGESHHDA